jgi:hypothetical protein
MRILAGAALRGPVAPATAFFAFASLASAGVLTTFPVEKIAPVVFGAVLVGATYRRALQWRSLMVATVLVILFIPMRRYTLPSSLPFQLEPYRLIVAFVALAWFTSLLIDPRVRFRRTGLEAPLAAYVISIAASLLLNGTRVEETSSVLVKTLMFTASYFVVVYLLPSVLSHVADIDALCKAFVGGGAAVAAAAVVESRTGYNAFNHLTHVIPVLHLESLPFANGADPTGMSRGGRIRAYASAEHPIALGAALAMLIPLTPYLAKRTGQRRWWLCAGLLMMGLFATVSRTGFLMLIVVVIVFAWFRWHEVKRFWPALLPLVVVIHFAVPGTLGTMFQSFFPKGGLVAQQANQNVGSGRLATLGPVLRKEFLPNPIFGEGYGTRISGENGPGVVDNAPILDDEWAGVLAEVGVFGSLALAWLLVRTVRRMRRLSKECDDDVDLLATGLAAGIASFGIGMLTFDAFSFVQATFLFWFFLSLAGALMAQMARQQGTL